MTFGSWAVGTLYRANGRVIATEKNYSSRRTAESHYDNMRAKVDCYSSVDIVALILQHPSGATVRQFNREGTQNDRS